MLRFLMQVWKFEKWSQKTYFLAFFRKFFGHALSQPISHAQIFCQIKGLIKIHSRVKFHLHSICGSQVINFKKVPWQWSIHELGHFGVFLGPNFPKYGPILLKLAPEVASSRGTESFKKFWQIRIFRETARYQNFFFFKFLLNFGAHLPHEGVRNRKKLIFL